jgi:hypothetical protein
MRDVAASRRAESLHGVGGLTTAVTLPTARGFGDLHRRAVSDHFQSLAAITEGGYAA